MTHIGIDSRLTYYRTGGISAYTRRLLHALASLDDDDERHYTIFHSRKEDYPQIGRFRHVPLWTPAHHRLERLALSVELARFRLDVFHSPDFIPPYRGAKHHVITVHDLTFLRYPQYLTSDSRRYYNAQIAAAVNHADHILVVSQSARQDLITLLNVPEIKMTVQPHGVDPQQYRPMPSAELTAAQKRLNLPEGGYLLHVGTIEPRKNILGLLQAYTDLLRRLSEAPPLVLVGQRGWLADETIAHIERTPQVYWMQNVADNDLPALYNLARGLVLPSFYEGFGMPALEAMACGVIPVVSNRSSLPEVVGEVGLQIDPDDPTTITNALYHLLTADAAWLTAQQNAAIQRAGQFTWERSAQIARTVYEQVAR
jgi:glycosyltransferase involved in cell wall biosynthesis